MDRRDGILRRTLCTGVRRIDAQKGSLVAAGLADILAPGLAVVFCGLNPGVAAAATGHHFVGRGNRFWRVLHLAGFTPTQIDPMHDTSILSLGYGLTAVVARPTASAEEVTHDELGKGYRAL